MKASLDVLTISVVLMLAMEVSSAGRLILARLSVVMTETVLMLVINSVVKVMVGMMFVLMVAVVVVVVVVIYSLVMIVAVM